ncbi:MAG TPA: NAD(P)/FAD-dependent oxidoreductase [Pyrinomonadaceae bacterium]|nr:NAD(P)/FAD-dependent oxidoreductase [Pyrinomonadaceae bacterium]
MRKYDVVIVGAGLAGLQCSRLLGRAGLKVLLIDRKERLSDSIHTTGIFVRRTLEDFDIPEDCLGSPVRQVTLHSPARRSLELTSPHDEFRIGRMGRLYERFLEQSQQAGVEWMPATRCTDHSLLKDEVVLRLDTKRSSRWVTARYIVGADGASSRVARDLNLDRNSEWIVGVEDVYARGHHGTPRLQCFLDRNLAPGYLAWIADDGDEVHVGVGGYPAMFDPLSALDQFQKSIANDVDLSCSKWRERRGGRIPVGGVLKRIANNHGLLVGDAAGAVSPLTAGGLDPCMRLSTFAAEVITKYLGANDESVLASYSGKLFRTRFTSRIWMRRAIATFNQPALELAFLALRLPLMKAFANQIFFGRGSFPDVGTHRSDYPTVEAARPSVASHIL